MYSSNTMGVVLLIDLPINLIILLIADVNRVIQ